MAPAAELLLHVDVRVPWSRLIITDAVFSIPSGARDPSTLKFFEGDRDPSLCSGLPKRSPSLPLQLPRFPPPAGAFVTTLLFCCLGDNWWNLVMAPMLIDRHKGQIGGSHVARGSGNVVFHPALHSHLHRRVEGAVDR